MITSGSCPRLSAIGAQVQSLFRLRWFFSLIIAVLFTVAATPLPDEDNPDAQYIHIMAIVDRADALRVSGKADAAKAKYKEAEAALMNFKRLNPLWYPKTVAYRLNEIADRVETKPPVTEPVEPAPKPKMKLESEPAGAASKSPVKLLDAGAEPRKALRLHAKAGDKQTAFITVKNSVEMPGVGAPGNPMKLPAISLPAEVTVQSVAANGDISYQFVLEEAGIVEDPAVPAQSAQTMKTAISGLKGSTVTAVMSNRGMEKKMDVKAPPGANPQVQQMVDQMKEGMSNMDMPLPEEAVGVGAKWEVKQPVKSMGMSIDQTASYELVSVDGDHLNLAFTVAQTAANQKIENPAMGGAQMNLTQMTGSGKGTFATELSRAIASQATMDVHIEINGEVTAGGKKTPLAMKMDTSYDMEAK